MIIATVFACLAIGCDPTMLGGSKTVLMDEHKLPARVRDAFTESHPDTPILRVEEVISNAPTVYAIHYRAPGGAERVANYRYAPRWLMEHEVVEKFHRDHPDAKATSVELFADYESGRGWNLIRFDSDTGPNEAKYEFAVAKTSN
jgi:hypothetical protein